MDSGEGYWRPALLDTQKAVGEDMMVVVVVVGGSRGGDWKAIAEVSSL